MLNEDQKQFILKCEQKDWKIYLDRKKEHYKTIVNFNINILALYYSIVFYFIKML